MSGAKIDHIPLLGSILGIIPGIMGIKRTHGRVSPHWERSPLLRAPVSDIPGTLSISTSLDCPDHANDRANAYSVGSNDRHGNARILRVSIWNREFQRDLAVRPLANAATNRGIRELYRTRLSAKARTV